MRSLLAAHKMGPSHHVNPRSPEGIIQVGICEFLKGFFLSFHDRLKKEIANRLMSHDDHHCAHALGGRDISRTSTI